MTTFSNIQIVLLSRNDEQLLQDYASILHEKENLSFDTVHSNLLNSLSQNPEFLNPSISSNSTFIAYFNQKVPIGFISIAKVFKPDARHYFLYVDELYVMKNYRKQSVGTKLLEHVKQIHPFVRLLCRVDNVGAQQVYEKSEFILSPTLLGQYYK